MTTDTETSPSTEHNSSTTNDADMKVTINPQRATTLISNLEHIQQCISSALSSQPARSSTPRLVAVSKLKPASDILALHNPPTSQQHFGENYVQELLEKSKLLPSSIRWHFIGGLQSNKASHLARDVDSLWAVESIDSEKKATLLNKGRSERNTRLNDSTPLNVFIQVNTSGEDSKSGVAPDSSELVSLAKHIRETCENLHLQGLMTIGAIARSKATTPETENEDFICLRETRDKLAKELEIDKDKLELSMGMSEDFEGAIRQGSSEVRVGSTIFGERPAKKDARVLEDTEAEKK
ncbi:YggS family pyridoxal phosphate enzyme [Exophiala viscosa]|uniref:YggS family pyridoxal phosphate enzyme n=1 Tax=Exophiala viscosa TaxID=2486360 RepID=UPI00218D353D|nr:YggS family pyridoxal phosphate enzyme [Exophiala viscosa]